jgi:crossover junction endodeoxyribonuclease RusA
MTSAAPLRFTIEYGARPWTTNAERKGSRWERADRTKEWRNAFYWLAKQQRIPAMTRVVIVVEPWQAGGVLADTAACNPAAKAAIDGIVDAGVIPDDGPEFVAEIRFLPTRKGRDALLIHLIETENHRDN